MLFTTALLKNNPVVGWGGLSKKSNVKMWKECPKLAVMHNMSIVKKSNSWTMDDTDNFICWGLTSMGGVYMEISLQIINLQTEFNYLE